MTTPPDAEQTLGAQDVEQKLHKLWNALCAASIANPTPECVQSGAVVTAHVLTEAEVRELEALHRAEGT